MTSVATPNEIDRHLEELRLGAQRWIALSPSAKADLLEAVRASTYAQAARWAAAAVEAKGLAGTPLAGEEWISGPWALIYAINRYVVTMRQIARSGGPEIPANRVRTRPDGQVVVDVFPDGVFDQLLLSGVRGEVWMQPGVTPENLGDTMGVWYRTPDPQPRVALVLGAGNIAAIAPLDVLYKLLADGAVCILKMNPVNEYLGPILEDALKPLVDGGFLRFAYGGAETGKLLCAHPMVDEIHITGSDKTHDRIVFGDGPDAEDRKRRDDPVLDKLITSELGNVSPTIVVPGPWSDADFRFQAEQIVTQKMHNGGFNCIAAQVLILPSDWDGTQKLIDAVNEVFSEVLDRPAYYPGAADRCERLSSVPGTAVRYGRTGDGFTARTIVTVDAQSGSPNFEIEAFSSLLTITRLPGDTATFLRDAVSFANDKLWGTLGGNVIAHPQTMKQYETELDAAVAALRYGCVAVNAWTGVGFLLTETTWGAFPGHRRNDVRSGIGVVHNSHLFDKAQKSVIYGPFAPFPRSMFGYGATMLPKPPWFVTNKMAAQVGEALVDFEVNPNMLAATKVALLAMQG
jgi:aldehyde dehydrogenase (NAD(P)+)